MERWVVDALLAMSFAGMTSVMAKQGLAGISGDLGLAVRTAFVFVYVVGFTAVVVPRAEWRALGTHNLLWLGGSAITTALSWIFYYRALKVGEVATVALIDKGSFLVALLLAWLFLGERLTARTLIGAGLILAGLLVVAKR